MHQGYQASEVGQGILDCVLTRQSHEMFGEGVSQLDCWSQYNVGYFHHWHSHSTTYAMQYLCVLWICDASWQCIRVPVKSYHFVDYWIVDLRSQEPFRRSKFGTRNVGDLLEGAYHFEFICNINNLIILAEPFNLPVLVGRKPPKPRESK